MNKDVQVNRGESGGGVGCIDAKVARKSNSETIKKRDRANSIMHDHQTLSPHLRGQLLHASPRLRTVLLIGVLGAGKGITNNREKGSEKSNKNDWDYLLSGEVTGGNQEKGVMT